MVQLAIKRLSPKEAYDRVYRMRRAFQVYNFWTIRKLASTGAANMLTWRIVLATTSTAPETRMDHGRRGELTASPSLSFPPTVCYNSSRQDG